MSDLLDVIPTQKLGPVAPIPDKTPLEIHLLCTQAYSRGKQAAKHPEIIGPEVPDTASDIQKVVLATYFALGMEAKPVTTNQTSEAPKGRKPEDFHGEREKYNSFVKQLALCFGADPVKFYTERSKISFAASFLRGPAFSWLEPYTNELTGEVSFSSYRDFLNGLKAGFADPDAYATAERDIETISQKSSCSAYYSQFVALIAQLGWTEDAVKIHYFRRGLKDSIKDILVGRELPTSICDFANLCIKLDNQIEARTQERRGSKQFRNSNMSFGHQLTDTKHALESVEKSKITLPENHNRPVVGEPMELDAISRKAYRRANNLCTYCGGAGHWVKNCTKARNKTLAAATISNYSSPKITAEPLYQAKN